MTKEIKGYGELQLKLLLRPNTFDEIEVEALDTLYGDQIESFAFAVYEFNARPGTLADDPFDDGSGPGAPRRKLRRKMLADSREGEVGEFLDADFGNDLVEYVDGAIDVAYVAIGAVIEATQGNVIAADHLIKEVMRSNATKLIDCQVRDDGKVIKGKYFQAPRIKAILDYYQISIPPVSQGALFKFEGSVSQPVSATTKDGNEILQNLGIEGNAK